MRKLLWLLLPFGGLVLAVLLLKKKWPLAAGVEEFLLSWKRGIKNNNPANLEYHPETQWLGLDTPPTDGRFCRFKDMVDPTDGVSKPGAFWGLRATGISALTNAKTYTNLLTWGENNTPASENGGEVGDYGRELGKTLGVDPAADFNFEANMAPFLRALVINEETVVPYTDSLFLEAANAAVTHGGA